MGYHRAGFEVVGVDNKPQPRYPFEFHCEDAFAFLEKHGHEFDVIHASPPCQAYSVAQNFRKNRDAHPQLIEPIREMLIKSGKDWIIENVVGAPLQRHVMLCGSMFGQPWHRHRVFEFSERLLLLSPTHGFHKSRGRYQPGKVMISMMDGDLEEMGFDWMKKRTEKREAIPPAYTEWIGLQLMAVPR